MGPLAEIISSDGNGQRSMIEERSRNWNTLRVRWTARRSNQSVLKEISPEYSLEGLRLRLKFWPPFAKRGFIGKDLDAGKD